MFITVTETSGWSLSLLLEFSSSTHTQSSKGEKFEGRILGLEVLFLIHDGPFKVNSGGDKASSVTQNVVNQKIYFGGKQIFLFLNKIERKKSFSNKITLDLDN